MVGEEGKVGAETDPLTCCAHLLVVFPLVQMKVTIARLDDPLINATLFLQTWSFSQQGLALPPKKMTKTCYADNGGAEEHV